MRHDIWYVLVPDELTEPLFLNGFDSTSERGVLDAFQTASTIAVNLVTIIVAKEKIKELADIVRNWMTRKAAESEGSELILNLTARNGDNQVEIQVTARCAEAGSRPQLDMGALAAWVTSVLED